MKPITMTRGLGPIMGGDSNLQQSDIPGDIAICCPPVGINVGIAEVEVNIKTTD